MSNIDTAEIDEFIKKLNGLTFTEPIQKSLAKQYEKIGDKNRLKYLIENLKSSKLKKKLNIVIRIAEAQLQPPAPPPAQPQPPPPAHAQGAPQPPPPALAQPKRPSGAVPPSVEATGALSPSIAAPSVEATGAPSPSIAASNRPSGAAAPSVAASNKPSGAAAPSVTNKNEKKREITQKKEFNNYTDFENFFLTEKINIVNTVATAALKIENSDNLGKRIFLDLKNITNKLDLKILSIKKNYL